MPASWGSADIYVNNKGKKTHIKIPMISKIECEVNANLSTVPTYLYGYQNNFAIDLGNTQKYTITCQRVCPIPYNDNVSEENQEQWSNGKWYRFVEETLDFWQNNGFDYDNDSKRLGGFRFEFHSADEELYPSFTKNCFLSGTLSIDYTVQKLRIIFPLQIGDMDPTGTKTSEPVILTLRTTNPSAPDVIQKVGRGVNSTIPFRPSSWDSVMKDGFIKEWRLNSPDGLALYPGDRYRFNIDTVLYAVWGRAIRCISSENATEVIIQEGETRAMIIAVGGGAGAGSWFWGTDTWGDWSDGWVPGAAGSSGQTSSVNLAVEVGDRITWDIGKGGESSSVQNRKTKAVGESGSPGKPTYVMLNNERLYALDASGGLPGSGSWKKAQGKRQSGVTEERFSLGTGGAKYGRGGSVAYPDHYGGHGSWNTNPKGADGECEGESNKDNVGKGADYYYWTSGILGIITNYAMGPPGGGCSDLNISGTAEKTGPYSYQSVGGNGKNTLGADNSQNGRYGGGAGSGFPGGRGGDGIVIVLTYRGHTMETGGTMLLRWGSNTIHLGTVERITETFTKNTSVTPLVSLDMEKAFPIDSGTSKTYSITFSRVTPTNPIDGSTNSAEWSNGVWIRAMEEAINRWQCRTDGFQLQYTPSPDNPYIAPIDVHGYVKSFSYTIAEGQPTLITGNLAFTAGTMYVKIKKKQEDFPNRLVDDFAIILSDREGAELYYLLDRDVSCVSAYTMCGGPECPFEYIELKVPKQKLSLICPPMAEEDAIVAGMNKLYVSAIGTSTMTVTNCKLSNETYTIRAYCDAERYKGMTLKEDFLATPDQWIRYILNGELTQSWGFPSEDIIMNYDKSVWGDCEVIKFDKGANIWYILQVCAMCLRARVFFCWDKAFVIDYTNSDGRALRKFDDINLYTLSQDDVLYGAIVGTPEMDDEGQDTIINSLNVIAGKYNDPSATEYQMFFHEHSVALYGEQEGVIQVTQLTHQAPDDTIKQGIRTRGEGTEDNPYSEWVGRFSAADLEGGDITIYAYRNTELQVINVGATENDLVVFSNLTPDRGLAIYGDVSDEGDGDANDNKDGDGEGDDDADSDDDVVVALKSNWIYGKIEGGGSISFQVTGGGKTITVTIEVDPRAVGEMGPQVSTFASNYLEYRAYPQQTVNLTVKEYHEETGGPAWSPTFWPASYTDLIVDFKGETKITNKVPFTSEHPAPKERSPILLSLSSYTYNYPKGTAEYTWGQMASIDLASSTSQILSRLNN